MSKACFVYTFLRLIRPLGWFTAPGLIVGPILIALGYSATTPMSPEMANESLSGFCHTICHPIAIILLSMLIVGRITGNSNSLQDGEYLMLTFTRPLSRFSYVFTKWCAGALAMAMILTYLVLAVTFSLFAFAHANSFPLSEIEFCSLILNCLGCSALIVFAKSCPKRPCGLILTISILCILSSPYLVQTWSFRYDMHPENTFLYYLYLLFDFLYWKIYPVIQDFFLPFVDLTPCFNSMEIWWLPVLMYLSNCAIYLWLAVVVLNYREFFYANE